MKKILSLTLVGSMILSSMSMAFAATPATRALTDIADSDYEAAIEALVALDVIDGYEDGTYRPEKSVTRAEMAKILVEALGYGDLVQGAASPFSDAKGHWADGYIGMAAGKGLVSGYPNGTFLPDQTVSYSEALTMAVRAIGYTDGYLGGTWPTNFKTKAVDLGLTDDVAMSSTEADRGGIAQIIYNALETQLVTINSDGDAVYEEIDKDTNKLFIDNIAEYHEEYDVSSDKVDPGNKNFAGELINLQQHMYQNLEAYINDDDQVVYIKDTNSLVIEGEVDDVYTVGDDVVIAIEEADGDIEKVKFADVALIDDVEDSVFQNGWTATDITYEDLLEGSVDDVKIIANDEDGNDDGQIQEGEVKGFVITNRTETVRVEKEYVEGNDSLDGIDLPVDENDDVDLKYITVTGEAESLEDVQLDDIVVAYASQDTEAITLVVSRSTVEGEVTRLYDTDTIYIDGKAYDISALSLEDDFDLGDEGVFYLDQNGEIADYDGESVGPANYAIVTGISQGATEEDFGDFSIDEYPEIKFATQDDEEVVYEVDVEVDSDEEVDADADTNTTDEVAFDDGATVYGEDDQDNEEPLITVGDSDTDTDTDDLEFNSLISSIDTEAVVGILVKYELNSDGRISEIEVLEELTSSSFSDLDLEDSDNQLTDGAVAFDSDDDFAVVDVEDLDTDMDSAYAYRNDDGEIEIIVAGPDEVDGTTDTVFAFVEKISLAYDENGDKVNQFVIYTDGQKKELFSDDDKFTSTVNRKYAIGFEYDGDVIDSDKLITAKSDLAAYGTTATAISVNASKGLIKLETGLATTYVEAGTVDWFALSDHATVVMLDDAGDVDSLGDLYDIDEDDVIDAVYFNEDGEIDLIVIDKYDAYKVK